MNGTHAAHAHPPGRRSWRFHFGRLVHQHAVVKFTRGGVDISRATSYRTRLAADRTVMLLVKTLREELGFRVEKPDNLDPRHMQAWADWINRLREERARQPTTLAGYASAIRQLCRWSGKPELVAVLEKHLCASSTGRRLTTDRDKTFEGNGVDVVAAILAVWEVEPWVAMTLLAQHGFGLRRRESVCLSPERDLCWDEGHLHVRVGAKGGRPRPVPLRGDDQHLVARQLLDFVRWRNLATGRPLRAHSSLAPPHLRLKSALNRYTDVLARLGYTRAGLGVTGHGLRAGYVCHRLQELGIRPVVKGGLGRNEDPAQERTALMLVSESVGHSRTNIVGAYAGSPGVRERVLASEQLRRHGLLLSGADARTVEINAQRITDYLAAARSPSALATTTEGDGDGL
jgi:integrase